MNLEKLLVVSDFDGTLTKKIVDWKIVPSLISILRDQQLLDEDYSIKAKQLFDKYWPIEKDPNIPEQEKFNAMESWWKEHFNLKKEKWLKKGMIQKAVQHPNVQLKKGVKEFIEFLQKNNVYLIVFSSSGLWDESIKDVFDKFWVKMDNIFVISNQLLFDKNWKFIWVKEPIIHGANKTLKTFINDKKIKEIIEDKEQVLLIWDSLWDLKMVDWLSFDKILKIWFYLEDKPEIENIWKQKYDIVLDQEKDNFTKILDLLK